MFQFKVFDIKLNPKETSLLKSDEIDMRGKIAVALDLVEECKEFAALVPEVRTNLVFARLNSRSRGDVLGIDGRITVVNGLPHAAGKPRFGASSHMARLMVELGKADSTFRAGVNFANNPSLTNGSRSIATQKDGFSA